MNNTEHWASQIIDELFGAKDTSKEQSTLLICKDISDELELESSQAGSSFSKEIHQDILSQNTEVFPAKEHKTNELSDCISESGSTRTLNELFSISSPGQFKSDIIVSSSPLPDRLNYLNITHHPFRYLNCMLLDEHNQAHLKKKEINSGKRDYMNFRMSEPSSTIVASQHGDSESENSKISILKTSVENDCEFRSGDGSILSNETSASALLDEEIERKILKYRMELIVDQFRKIGRLFEVCFVVPLASFIANNSEFLEFCLALLFCTVYAFIWPKKPKDKSSRTRILTSEDLKDTKELTQPKEKVVEISTSSAPGECICPPRSIIKDKERGILHQAEIKTSKSSLKVLGDTGEKTKNSYLQVTPEISSIHECVDTASSLEFLNSIENLELDESNFSYSSLDYTIDFVQDNLKESVHDSTESSHDSTDFPKNSSVERKIVSSSDVSEEALEAPIICDDVKEEEIKSVKDSLGHSEIETEGAQHEVKSYKSVDESRDNVLSDVCVGNTDYGWSTDIKVEDVAENGLKESDVCVGNRDYSELGWSTDIKVEHNAENGLKESDVHIGNTDYSELGWSTNTKVEHAVENGLKEESDVCVGNTDYSELGWSTGIKVEHAVEKGLKESDVNAYNANMDDTSLEDEKMKDEDHLADASLEVNFSMEGLHHTNEFDDESEDGHEIDVEIPPFPDPSYEQQAHIDTTDSNKPELLLPTSYRPHITGKSRTLADLNSKPSSIFFEPKRTSSFPSVFKLEEGQFPIIKDSIGDRLHEESLVEPASWESFEVTPAKVATTPLDSTSEEQAECLNLKKKKKGGRMKKRISFIFRNIRELPRHLTHSAKEKGSTGYQKHRDA